MEDEHDSTFLKLRLDLSENEKIATTFNPEGETEKYLKVLADTRIFYKKEYDEPLLKRNFLK